MMFLFVLITFSGFVQIQKSTVEEQDVRHSEMVVQLLCNVTSSPYDVMQKDDDVMQTYHLPSRSRLNVYIRLRFKVGEDTFCASG